MLSNVFYLLLAALGILFAFYGGIVVGIADCKRQFDIPKKAVARDEFGFIFS